MEDLEKISKTEAFSDIEELKTPGGGYISEAKIPMELELMCVLA